MQDKQCEENSSYLPGCGTPYDWRNGCKFLHTQRLVYRLTVLSILL